MDVSDLRSIPTSFSNTNISSLSRVFSWNFLLGFFAPRIANDIGPLILLIFCGCLIFGFFFTYFCVPEVKGLSLEEVDELYKANIKPWKSTSWKPPSRQSKLVGGKRIVNGEIVDEEDYDGSRTPSATDNEKAVDDEKRVEGDVHIENV